MVIPIMLIQVGYRVLELLEREILYGKIFRLLVFFSSNLWTVILIDKFLGTQRYKYIWLMYWSWPPKTEILELEVKFCLWVWVIADMSLSNT